MLNAHSRGMEVYDTIVNNQGGLRGHGGAKSYPQNGRFGGARGYNFCLKNRQKGSFWRAHAPNTMVWGAGMGRSRRSRMKGMDEELRLSY